MNDDIRILRDALKRYRDFVEVPDGDPMEVPLYWYNSAKATYAEACSPDRIRRLLDDAERMEWIEKHATEPLHFGACEAPPNVGEFYVSGFGWAEGFAKTIRGVIDMARKEHP